MQLTININLDNDAFSDPGETNRILRNVGSIIEDFNGQPYPFELNLHDSNGNTVGTLKVEED